MDVKKILKEATDNGASDIFIVAGRPLTQIKGSDGVPQ
mgnify:CR=1 FL=1